MTKLINEWISKSLKNLFVSYYIGKCINIHSKFTVFLKKLAVCDLFSKTRSNLNDDGRFFYKHKGYKHVEARMLAEKQ